MIDFSSLLIWFSYNFYLKYITTKIIKMQEQSSNHSEHSNTFALSSESSRLSNTHKPKKQHYSAFISKVGHLL